jgi:imidazolonepropionase-like amidohydrolase
MSRFAAALSIIVALLCGWPALAAAPKLAKPPLDAEVWVYVSQAGEHGRVQRWVAKDGTRWSRETSELRGFKTDIDQQIVFAPDGSIARFEVRGRTPQGDAAETYSVANGRYAFKSPVDKGEGVARSNLAYFSFGGTIDATAVLLDALRRSSDPMLDLLPSGTMRLEKLTTAEVASGRVARTLTAYAVTGFGFAPQPVWYDGDRFFGIIGVLSYVPERWKEAIPALSKAQDEALAARAPELLARLAKRPNGAVAFEGVKLYDADARAFRDDLIVVVEGGRITMVGPLAATTIPAGAEVIGGKGKTLIPGLWDNHMHYGDDSTGPLLFAQGVTSVRDPGNQPEESMARKKRIDAGELLGPRILPSLIIDGPGERSAQGAVVVKNEEEAVAAVRRAKNDGFFGVKLYGSLNPRFVKPMAEEAHRLKLRVHGHVPAGMRPLEAVRAGYDELTHLNFTMMQAMPDAVVRESNGEARIFGPGRYAAGVDLKSAEMRAYLDELAQRKIAVDPTMPVLETLLLGERGKLPGAYAPYDGTLPPNVERQLRAGALTPPADLSRGTMKKSFAKFGALIAELHQRGIAILAGTDGYGLELVRDLELYAAAGMKPVDVLATATIVPAQTYGLAEETGSIAVGKKAELALIDGDPSKRIGDLRQVELVMSDGRMMRADELRAAVGITGAPKRTK